MKELLDYLASIEPGTLSDASELEVVLSKCWDDFTGGGVEGMAGYKLHKRMEGVTWAPPILNFFVERHGATVRGSTRAHLHRWDLNVRDRRALFFRGGYRQLHPMQPSLNLKPIAVEIVHLITGNEPDERLRWYPDGSVRVVVSKVPPKGYAVKQTLDGRRKRFRAEVRQMLQDTSWEEIRPDVYQRLR